MCIQQVPQGQVDDKYDHVSKLLSSNPSLLHVIPQQTNALQSLQNKKQQRALHSPLNNQPLHHPHNHLTNHSYLKYQPQFDLTCNYKPVPIFSYQQSKQIELKHHVRDKTYYDKLPDSGSYFFDDIYDNTPKLPPLSKDKNQQRAKLIKYPNKFKISQ
eukprot:183214_1